LTKEARKYGADIWTFRWRERDGKGKAVLRRITIGTTQQFPDRRTARKAVAGIVREINFHDSRIRTTSMTVIELVDHYRQRELSDDNTRITHSTKRAYEDNLRRWILPRWAKILSQCCEGDGGRIVARKHRTCPLNLRQAAQPDEPAVQPRSQT